MQHTTERIDCQENGRIVAALCHPRAKGSGSASRTSSGKSRRVELHFQRSVDPCNGRRLRGIYVNVGIATRRADPVTKLTNPNLSLLSIPVPSYDRSQVGVGIVHFGVGGFHRAHQAMYVDSLMDQGKALDWGICGVGVMPFDLKIRDALVSQDCLYTLVLKDPQGRWEPTVIGSIVKYLYAADDPEAVIEQMADPATRIVSLTVTEGGYNFHPVTGKFDAENPAVQADLRPGAVPTTTFGLITEAVARRRARGIEPFTVMSCDNIQGNGHVAKEVFTAFAGLRDPELGDWVEANVRFPNSMVDRITPATTDDDRAQIKERFGVDDAWPVVCEPFTQWALEDDFSAGRPPLENAGVQVVPDVLPYELMKLRLLNAGHQALGYFGYLAGYGWCTRRHRTRSSPTSSSTT